MKKLLLFTAVLCGLMTIGCNQGPRSSKPRNTSTSGLATVVCDESFKNILDQEIEVFEFTYRDAHIIPYYTSEVAAIDSMLQLKTKLIVTAHELTPKQKDFLRERKGFCRTQRIAVDAIALIVNNDNPCDILSLGEIKEILQGKITDWNELSPNKSGKISVVFDDQGSSTVQYMRDSLLNGDTIAGNAYAQNSSNAVFQAVEKNKGAIGVIGVSWISADMKAKEMTTEERVADLNEENVTTTTFSNKIKVLKVRRDDQLEAYQPYQAYIYDARYPLFRNIYATCTSPDGDLSQGFYSFMTGFIGQKIIQQTGILPSVIQPRMVNLN